MKAITKVLNGIITAISVVAALGVAVMMLHIVIDSALRFLFNSPLPGTLDYTQYWWMITIGFGGLALAYRTDEHVEATVLSDRMQGKYRAFWDAVQRIVLLVGLLGIFWFGLVAANKARDDGEYSAGTDVTIWPMRYWVPIGALAFIVAILISWHSSKHTNSGEDALYAEVTEAEVER